MENQEMLEQHEALVAHKAEKFYETYKPQMNTFESSLVAKAGGVNKYNIFALGQMLEDWKFYMRVCETNGNINQLGILQKIGFDVIAVAFGQSIVPLVASIQPINSPRGLVYYRNLKFGTTKGTHTAGNSMLNANTGVNTPQNYASNYVTGAAVGTGDGTTKTFTGTFTSKPIRSQTIVVSVTDSTVAGQDINGDGVIIGNGVTGTVDYVSGAFSIVYATAPVNAKAITAAYQLNYELATDLPILDQEYDSKTIDARIFALKGVTGLFQSYAMEKQFGIDLSEENAANLVGAINAELGADLITKMLANAQGNTEWDKAAPAGTGVFEHYMSLPFAVSDAQALLGANAGRGQISGIVAGSKLCAIIENMAGFEKLSDGTALGCHIFGNWKGRTVIKVNDANVLAAHIGLPYYKGTNPFDAPIVHASFMPLGVTTAMPIGQNPLGQQRAAAMWAGQEVMIKEFITKITVLHP